MTESRIYTKLGDDGSTGLLFGGRVSKDGPLVETLGSIDEAVAALGLARSTSTDRSLTATILRIQRELFVVAADLAANPHTRGRLVPGISQVTTAMTAGVESLIDELTAAHPLQPVFLVPGANTTSAALDLARTIVRRAERRLVGYRADLTDGRTLDVQLLTYLNRVSDLLYVLARQAAGDEEEPISHDT